MKVVVTGTTWSAGLAVARSLAQSGHDVIGVDTRELPFKIQSRFLRRSYRLPKAEKGFISGLIDVLRIEKPGLLLPVNDTRTIARFKTDLQARTAILAPDWHSYAAAYDNRQTSLECRLLGIAAPRVLSLMEAKDILEEAGGLSKARVVLKPRADVGGARGVHFIDDPAALAATIERLEARYGPAFIQECIPGRNAMRTANLLFDNHSELVAYFTMAKLREWPASGGITVLGISTREEGLVAGVLPIFKKWRWQGPAEVEFKLDPRDGQAKVIEINPRFPGYTGFMIQCGADFPQTIVRLVEGEGHPPGDQPEYTLGAKYIQLNAYARAVGRELAHNPCRRSIMNRIRSELHGEKYTNHDGWTDWRVLLAKAMIRQRPSMTGWNPDVRD